MDQNIAQRVEQWRAGCTDPELAAELADLEARAAADADGESALVDAFYQDLAFGTAGLRGVIGVGSNRMNVYTVAQATQGLASYLNAHFEHPTVAIARDSRNKGELFVQVAAGVLAANGITALLYPRIEPVPALSFATRYLGCSAGICMTASHNPAAYNGYKVYGADGCQIASQAAADIQAAINETPVFGGARQMDFEEAQAKGLVRWIGEEVLDAFVDAVLTQSQPEAIEAARGFADFKVVYTPLNGTGIELMRRVLDRIGVRNMVVVPEQEMPDGNFPTCTYPNPENRAALVKGLELCETERPDLLLATDPDADRVGIAVPHDGAYVLLSGNEVGTLLLDWLCRVKAQAGENLTSKVAVSTIVSTSMPDALARHYGFEMRRVLTGFKYIGDQIDQLERAGRGEDFLFGFEESYGYLAGTHVRDKDGIVAGMLICEMAAWYAARGKDLYQAMDDLYAEHGYYLNGVINVQFPGAEGSARMKELMAGLRGAEAPSEVAGLAVEGVRDYAQGVAMPVVCGAQAAACEGDACGCGDGCGEKAGAEATEDAEAAEAESQVLPSANVIEFQLAGGSKVIVRPSGTEPKIKAYLFANAPTRAAAEKLRDELSEAAKSLLQ